MKLKDLVGYHILDAVDFKDSKVYEEFEDSYLNSTTCRFRLDGIIYVAIEDPNDGYRSMMKDLELGIFGEITNVFEPVWVEAVYLQERKDKCWEDGSDILKLIDLKTGRTVLEVGTGNTDDYYPYFVADFDPTAMASNYNLGE